MELHNKPRVYIIHLTLYKKFFGGKVIMAKIQYCKNCGCLTEHSYAGKLKNEEDTSFNRFATIITLGGYQIAKKLFDDSPKCFKCNKCGHISKE